jgi:uncharacterized repeat protein (TIGR01451 family)
MRKLGVTRLLLLAGALAVAGLLAGVGSAVGSNFAVAISKGCDGPAYVGDPYECNSSLQNLDSQGNAYVVHSLVDRVTGSGGTTSYNLFALHVPLVFVNHNNATSVSCTNGTGTGTSGDPFIPSSTTTCTLPGDLTLAKQGGEIDVGDSNFSTYMVLPGDFTAGTVTDQIEYDVTDSCDVVSTNCNSITVNPETANGSTDVVQRPSKAVTTILHGENAVTTVAIGSTVHDSGLVSENTAAEAPPPINPGPVPTGSVSITFFQGGTCDGTVLDTGSATLDSAGAFNATGMPETLTAAGQYSFQATYNGDGTYSPSPAAGCEPLTVVRNSPEIATELSASTVNDGGAVHDSATLSGATSDAAGTVTYSVYSDNECSDKVADGGTVDVADGLVPNSNDVTLHAPGTYYWQASYSGDANNDPAVSNCTDEPLVVAPVVDLAITKSGSPATQVLTSSSTITWTMVVTNNGPDTDTGVKVSDPMPAGNTYVSSSTTQGTCTGGATLNCDLGTMAAGATVTITLVTKPSEPGTQTNTAVVMGDKPETNLTNNTATASVELTVPKPFLPCVQIKKITPGQLIVGRKTLVTIHLFAKGREVKGVKVRIKGAGINLKTNGANTNGVIKHTLKLKKKGVLTFTPIQPGPTSQTCSGKRIGVRGVFTPPVTG